MQGTPAVFVVAVLLTSACRAPEPWLDQPPRSTEATEAPAEHAPTPPVAAPTVTAFRSPQGIEIPRTPRTYGETSVEGRDLHYWVLGDGPDSVLILGGVHGNEKSSSELAFRFLAWLYDNPTAMQGRRVVIAPLVNPDGFQRGTRENASGVDLNRNFPAVNWVAGKGSHRPGLFPRSEPETRFTMSLLSLYEPRRVVSLHGAASCVNYDGPAEDLAERMARHCGLPVKSSIGYPTPGSFGSYLGLDRQIPVITLELTANSRIARPVEGYRRALLTALHHPDDPPFTFAK